MTWTVRMGASGGVLASYTDFVDFDFIDDLYQYGAAFLYFSGLSGNAVPVEDWVIKIIWNEGTGSEQVHWQGVVVQSDVKQEGKQYVVRAFTLDYLLHASQAGVIRNYLALTPHAIMQAAGSPNPLLTNAQGNNVIGYGVAAIPNLVNGANPGVALAQFVSDSTTLFGNMRRLCLQSRYSGASYGLEWTTTLEGANGSTPKFYLVRRRESRTGYTPEVFLIPDDLTQTRSGSNKAAGVTAVKVIGGGDGATRIESSIAGAGTREYVGVDKGIVQTVNADNMANRLLDIFNAAIPLMEAETYRHNSPTRAGDTITTTKNGVSTNTRVMLRAYSLSQKAFGFILGRPSLTGRDITSSVASTASQDQTVPQFTDTVPKSLQSGVQYYIDDRSANLVVGAGATGNILNSSGDTIFAGSSFADLGKCESLLCQLILDVSAATIAAGGSHQHTYDRSLDVTGSYNAGWDGFTVGADHYHDIVHTSEATGSASGTPTISGPFQVEAKLYFNSGQSVVIMQRVFPFLRAGERYFDLSAYNFSVEDPTAPASDFTPTQLIVTLRNDGPNSITLRGTGNRASSTEFGIWRKPLHDHNRI